MIMEIISIAAGLCLALALSGGSLKNIIWLLDMPSLICILVLTVPVLLRNGLCKDFLRAFKLLKKDYTCHLSELRRTLDVVELMQKQVLYAGIFSMLVSFLCMLHFISKPETLGPSISVTILTIFYAVILEMLLLPLQIEVKRRIIDYIGEE